LNKIHIEQYRNFIYHVIKQNIIEPLSKEIETNLRIQVHENHEYNKKFNNNNKNDYDNYCDNNDGIEKNIKTSNINVLKSFLDLSSIHVLGMVINIKNDLIYYLNKNFYNLNALAVHDSVVRYICIYI
jgi:mannose-6-phosphate isomerase class I